MTAEDPNLLALRRYIQVGTDYSSVRQVDFMNLVPCPEFQYRGRPTTSLSEIIKGVDMFQVAIRVRAIYVPGFSLEEADNLTHAFDWYRNKFEARAGYAGETGMSFHFPPHVEANFNTLFFLGSLDEFGYSKLNPGDKRRFVAFAPWTSDWYTDIHASTLGQFEKLKLEPYAMGKRFNPGLFSTSRTLDTLNAFFRSAGEEKRGEAVDLLTYELLKVYWMRLVARAKIKDPLLRL